MTSNTDTKSTAEAPKAPKLTMKFLDDTKADKSTTATAFAGVHTRIDGVDDNIGLANTKVDGVKRELVGLRYLVGELKRKGQGTTLANARVATLESELGKITQRLDEINGKSSDKLDPAALAAFQQEAQRLNTRLEALFGQASADVAAQRERLDTLESRVDGHDVSIGMLDEGQSSLNERVDGVSRRVTVIERLRDTLPKWPLVIGLIAGVIGGIIWEMIEFNQSYPLADGTTKVVPLEAANSIWAAIAAGVGVFVVVTALALYFAKAKVEQDEPQHVAPPVPTPSHVQTVHSAPAEPDAPTKVLVTEGARPGTR